ncbi:MAG: GNAT family N-acetyltransferase [Gammaproteobacteria bacterium]|nr:GNAT family N-acetyltransferase [Gammaproteobacteria bacterium]
MEIKQLTAADHLDLLPAFVELQAYYFGDEAATPEQVRAYLLDGLFSEQSGVRVSGAYSGSRIVGFATYTIMYPAPQLSGQLYMKELFVASEARGQSVGRQLMKYLARYAIDNRCVRLDWTAETTNPNAGRFYRSIGAPRMPEKEYYRFEGDTLKAFAAAL